MRTDLEKARAAEDDNEGRPGVIYRLP